MDTSTHHLPAGHDIHVVVIDDQPMAIEFVRRVLADDQRIKVHGFTDSAVALTEIRGPLAQVEIDLVVIDLMMPGITGFDAIAAVRQLPWVGAIPILALTASDDEVVRRQALDLGAREVIVKMPPPHELRDILLRHIDAGVTLHATRSEPDDGVVRLGALEQSANELAQLNDPETVLMRVLTDARQFTHCEAGGVFVREGNQLRMVYAQNDVLGSAERFVRSVVLPLDTSSIAGYVAVTGKILHVPDVYDLPSEAPYRFNRSVDERTGYRTRSILGVPLLGESGRCIGVFQLINPHRADGASTIGFEPGDIGVAARFAATVSMSVQRAQLTKSLIDRTIAMARLRDPSETGPHVQRVSRISRILLEAWGARRGRNGPEWERDVDRFALAATLHDVGKVGVPDAVLKKPGKLDPEERAVMERHTTIGADLFGDDREFDLVAKRIALHHHQRWDGAGYPPVPQVDGSERPLRGDAIPLEARIVGIADVYDALSARRCYKEPWTEDRVIELITGERGGQFDPEIVDLFMENLPTFRAILQAHEEEGLH